jgi:hypothetical protein
MGGMGMGGWMFIVEWEEWEWEAGWSWWNGKNGRLDDHIGMGSWMFIVEWEAGWS